jgi:putative peptidoglycan lipid II flippase
MAAARSVISSAKLIAVCTLLSRVTGLARDILLARAFGLDWIQDAFTYAFQIPNLFRRLFGEGALAAAFVPTFTRTLEHDGRDAAWRLLARTLALLSVVISGVIVVIGLILLAVWQLVPVDPESAAARQLLLSLTAIMLPFMLTICVVALFSSILNCVGSFVPAALTPVLMNISMIVALGWLAPTLHPGAPRAEVYIVALAVVVAGVVQILYLLPVLRAHGVQLGWRLDTRDPAVKRLLTLVVPVLLGQGVLAFGVYLDAQICILLTHKIGGPETFHLFGWEIRYPLTEGALSAVTYAQRLYQFPLGVLVLSLATAALPAFSRIASRGDWPAWSREVRGTLGLAVFEGILAGAMMITLAEPMMRFLFEYGRFTAAHSERAGTVLVYYGVGLWAYCAQHIVLRAFYSMGDVRTPLRISATLLPITVALNLALVWVPAIREAAFALSSILTASVAVVVGLVIVQRRVAQPLLNAGLLSDVARMLLAGGAAAAVVLLLRSPWTALARGVPGTVLSRGVETLGLLAIGGTTYVLAAWILRLPELRLLLARATPSHRADESP